MNSRILILFILISRLSIGQECCGDEFLKYPLKSIVSNCQLDTSKVLSKRVFTYNDEKKLVKSTLFENDIEVRRTIYNYNHKGLLSSKEFYDLIPELRLDRTRIFEYNTDDKLIYEGYDDTKGNNTKNSYQYNSDGLLINSSVECNYTHWKYGYEYNVDGRLIKKIKDGKLESLYEYDDGRKVKQINYNRVKDVVVTFEYEPNGNLLVKKENDKIVEQNNYLNGLLINRWTYYSGIDPCFDRCCGQYFLKYNYY